MLKTSKVEAREKLALKIYKNDMRVLSVLVFIIGVFNVYYMISLSSPQDDSIWVLISSAVFFIFATLLCICSFFVQERQCSVKSGWLNLLFSYLGFVNFIFTLLIVFYHFVLGGVALYFALMLLIALFRSFIYTLLNPCFICLFVLFPITLILTVYLMIRNKSINLFALVDNSLICRIGIFFNLLFLLLFGLMFIFKILN